MKKTWRVMGLYALAVALLATSCKKEERKLTNSFTAELTQPVSDAKTHIGSYNGNSNYLLWNSGDQIKVFNAEGMAYVFSTTNSNVPVATFTSNTALDEEAAYCAFYPAANANGLTGGYIYLALSENQAYADGTFATGTYPVAASNGGSGTTFTFHSPCGVLAIPFKGSGTIGSIELTGKQNEPLAGQLQINPVGFDPENPSFSLVNPVTTITLTCANGLVLSAENAKTCMFVVPKDVFAQGFTAVVKDLNHNEIYTLETTKDNTIVAEQIMWMPTVNVAALAVTTDDAVVGENRVTLNGHFTTPEGLTVSEAGFYWGVGAMERQVGTVANNNISFTIEMEDLIQGTTYNVYAFAKNGNVETIGNTMTFTIEAPASAPVVVTAPAGHETPDLSVGTAVCYGGIESLDGITEYGICYSTESFSKATVQYVQSDNWANGVFSATLNGLGNGTTVYYRAYAINTAGYGYGEIESFTTPEAPTVTTTEATEITTTNAVCGGNVTADGGVTVTARGVCYGTSQNPTVGDSHTTNGTGTGSFTSNLEGLTPNTTYYVRAYATNEIATSYGEEVSFTTEEEIVVTVPTVTTNAVIDITTNSAVVGGQITNTGNGTISESGICYKTGNEDWTCVSIASTSNNFTLTLTDLTSNTIYTVRAYATNEEGAGYGEEVSFTTLEDIPTIPEGAINGLFTINANGEQVYFSQGNLQYQASTNTWRFAENQWDYVGDTNYGTVYENGVKCNNLLISSTYDGWIDLFGWGTSGYNHGATCYQPWSTQQSYGYYYAYGQPHYNLYDGNGQADWGYNAISNGSDTENSGWRTLTDNEWDYVCNNRTTVSGIRFAGAWVNGIQGIILLPDNWTVSIYSLSTSNYESNIISAEDWTNTLEANGAVFLPASGIRLGSYSVGNPGSVGNYWSASYFHSSGSSSNINATQMEVNRHTPNITYRSRYDGLSVRLVRNAE